MILQALTTYYEQLRQQGIMSPPGWDDHLKVSFQLRISTDGQLLDVVDCRQLVSEGSKAIPIEIKGPCHDKRSGTNPPSYFLCDNAKYLLGICKEEGKKEEDRKKEREKAAARFENCKALHHCILSTCDSVASKAVLSFFDQWVPKKGYDHPSLELYWRDLTSGANIIFCIETSEGSVLASEDPDICDAWQRYYDANDEEGTGQIKCLITGEETIAELVHPAIKGVRGAQSAGAALVSFNGPSFCSYGHEQGANAPIGRYAAFAYTTALNMLLADRDHCRYIGDTAVVCWAENANPSYASLGMMGIFGAQQDEGITDADIEKALAMLAKGQPCEFMRDKLQPEQRFYLLGISPNNARLVVRFFMQDTFGEFAAHIQEHNERLNIVRPVNDRYENLPIWKLLKETTRDSKDAKPSPRLSADLLRAVLMGNRYPATLLNGVNLRIRADREVTRGRAAIIKAFYLRNTVNNQTLIPREVLTVDLNEQSTYLPYVLGRLFAVLEGIQDAANPNINTTIKDRYFNAASATPAIAFPTLINLSQKHLAKLNDAQQVYYNKRLTALFDKIAQEYPARLSLPEQGAFQIGYYHETQKRYTKKEA